MKVGVPKEIKNNEYRVGIVPAGVKALVDEGHVVFVEKGAGLGSGISDREYEEAGAKILPDAASVYGESDMIMKVKEPLPQEYKLLKEGQIVYTYFHFASSKELTEAVLKSGIIAVAYETVEYQGKLPLLIPMSEVAGRMSVLVGSYYLARPHGGEGILPPGVPGVAPANVLVIGGGTVGYNAAKVAAGLGARVTILEKSLDRMRYLSDVMPSNVVTLMSNHHNLMDSLKEADLVIGAVLIPGAKTPKIVRREHLSVMKKGAVIVDVSVDQGGCVETTHPTTHENPVYEVDSVIHYAVANMPGAYARTSTFTLTNATLPYAVMLASMGLEAFKECESLKKGLNIFKGKITFKAVAEAHDMMDLYVPVDKVLA
ncbi:MAG: alanine dehydrogenase [Synergistetes bacterium]|nr:alanine dehydrogenase [Synergistota bacterium]